MWRQSGFYPPNISFPIQEQSSFRVLGELVEEHWVIDAFSCQAYFQSVCVILSELQSLSFHLYLNFFISDLACYWYLICTFTLCTRKLTFSKSNTEMSFEFWSSESKEGSAVPSPASLWIKLMRQIVCLFYSTNKMSSCETQTSSVY